MADMDDTGEPVCRFCFETGDDEQPLVSPCKCAGSLRYVHVKCLHRWQSQVMLSAASREVRNGQPLKGVQGSVGNRHSRPNFGLGQATERVFFFEKINQTLGPPRPRISSCRAAELCHDRSFTLHATTEVT